MLYFVGRGAKEANLYAEIAEGIYSYGITRHRHGEWTLIILTKMLGDAIRLNYLYASCL